MKIVEINKDYYSDFSCGIGSIKCSYEKLYCLFGDPKEGIDYKSDYEWTLILDNGDHINIYDWKIGKNYCGEKHGLNKEDIFNWNVGSNNGNLIGFLKSLVEDEGWSGFEKTRLNMFMKKDLTDKAVLRGAKWV